ncbi:hypothetical protein [Lysinibacillus telephonicus]|uniref:hypothetical protein n=1 Tax=Lysinibacillus telephonicus TaxID=1714840 RepID=UPI0037D4BA89
MDFEKIRSQAIRNAIDISVKEIFQAKETDALTKIEDEELQNDVGLIKLLQKFGAQVSIETIKIYHEELSQKLKDQGIDI